MYSEFVYVFYNNQMSVTWDGSVVFSGYSGILHRYSWNIVESAVNCPKHKPINTKFVFYGYRNSLVKIMKICSWKKEKRPSNRHRMRNVNNSCPFLVLLVPMKFQKKCRIDISSTISLHDFYSNSRHRYLPYVVFIL